MKFKLLILLSFLMVWGGENFAWAYSYGPACQWINLQGEIQAPPQARRPIELTVTYQLPNMGEPATLLTDQPIHQNQFLFYFAGFWEEIEGVRFVSPMFFFAKEIVFRAYAKSSDGKWRSEFQKWTWVPPRLPILDIPKYKDKNFLCHSQIQMDTLVLKKTPRRGRRRVTLGWP